MRPFVKKMLRVRGVLATAWHIPTHHVEENAEGNAIVTFHPVVAIASQPEKPLPKREDPAVLGERMATASSYGQTPHVAKQTSSLLLDCPMGLDTGNDSISTVFYLQKGSKDSAAYAFFS